MATEQQQSSGLGFDVGSLRSLDWVAIVLAASTGVIHLYLYTTEDWLPLLLAGAGFFGAIVLLVVLPKYRRWLYPIGVLFVLAQIVGYLLLPLGPLWIGVLDKVIQVALIATLVQLFRTADEREPVI